MGSRAKSGLLRIAQFAFASGLGFIVAEVILVLGFVAIYHRVEVPSLAHSSPTIIGLDALSLGIGVTAAFVINEGVTVSDQEHKRKKGRANWLIRLGKYQISSLLGNVVIVVVQLALLATVSLSPVFGSAVGAVVSFPVTYVVSMYFVWKVRLLRK